MIANYTLEQQATTANLHLSLNTAVSTVMTGAVAHKYKFNFTKAALTNLVVDSVEILFIRLLNNPPLTFTARLAVRSLCVAVVAGAYASTNPKKEDLKAVALGALVGSVTNIAMDLFRILISDDPSFLIAQKGYAVSIHNAIETARILHQAKHAVG